MILILLASIYVTFLCWCWGIILFKLLQLVTSERVDTTNFILTCFSGLSLIGVGFGFLSLFFPLGSFTAHICLALPAMAAVFFFRPIRPSNIQQAVRALKDLTPGVVALLLSGITLVLIMGASVIKHPDTLHYHVQCIKWIQDFKVVPGLANLGYHYGLQSSWFIVSAVFSFKFTGFDSYTVLNCTVIFWLICFLGFKINESLKLTAGRSAQIVPGLMWLLLFIVGFWSYTQVRLTVTSASPDFIAAIYIWLIFFIILSPGHARLSNSKLLLLVFLSLFAITIKLSSLPVMLLTLYYYRLSIMRSRNAWLHLVVCAAIVLAPAIIRNIITTGYPLFPSALGSFFNVDWKIPKDILYTRLDYITAYARLGDAGFLKDSDIASRMNFNEWMPIWWHNQSTADKVLLAGLVVMVLSKLLLFKRIKWRCCKAYFPALAVSVAGLLFWFLQAPDPRFGHGFIVTCGGILMYFLATCFTPGVSFNKNWLRAPLLAFTTALTFYSVYRITNFSKPADMVTPAGISKLPVKTIYCLGIKLLIPLDDLGCGDNELPCIYENCSEFSLRGRIVGEGFKPTKSLRNK